MREIICELKNINKQYQKRNILKSINIQLEKGKIYGFIGKNGAGKTTTMKIIAGLSFPDKGEVSIMRSSSKKELELVRRNIGCIIEMPALHPDMSAKENLKSLCILYGIDWKTRIESILALVGLQETGRKKVKHFSLGMRQRLAIGMALINDPILLILDEPINGLDPDGIVEIRELIRKINIEREVTVLISSHILNEIYMMVDNYIFINNGEIIEKLSKKELEARCQKYILIKSGNAAIIKEVLRNFLKTENFKEMSDGSFRLYDYTENVLEVMKVFSNTNVDTNEISVKEDSLEEYYFKRIG